MKKILLVIFILVGLILVGFVRNDKVNAATELSFTQTDWSGGGLQDELFSNTLAFSECVNVETLSPVGAVTISFIGDKYQDYATLTSSSFDGGVNPTWSKFSFDAVVPATTTLKFQLASSDNVSGPFTFVGPDGTTGTYYTQSPQIIAVAHSGKRYLRYKMFMATTSATVTPLLKEVSIAYTSTIWLRRRRRPIIQQTTRFHPDSRYARQRLRLFRDQK